VQVFVSAAADDDLMLIFSFLHQQSPQAAQSIADEVDQCFQECRYSHSAALLDRNWARA
jgi:plasmid stabilization system protein ParE